MSLITALLLLTQNRDPVAKRPLEEKLNYGVSPGSRPPRTPGSAANKVLWKYLKPLCRISAVAPEIGLVVFLAGKDQGWIAGDCFYVTRSIDGRHRLICSIIVDRADRTWSAGKVTQQSGTPTNVRGTF